MATLPSSGTPPGIVLTLADWASRRGPDGKVEQAIVEILSRACPLIKDSMWRPANSGGTHKSVIRAGLPQGFWRLINQGVPGEKSVTASIQDGCGMLESWSKVDKMLVDLEDDGAAFRASEAKAFIEGLGQTMESALVYSSALSTPAQITGLAPRYSTVNTANAASANNVIDAGGTGSTNTSIYGVCWGNDTAFGIFPKGSVGGLQHRDFGDAVPLVDANGLEFIGYRDHYKWDAGFVIKDWRYTFRIANIDVPSLIAGSGANLINSLIRAVNRWPTQPVGVGNVQTTDAPGGDPSAMRCALYMNRTVSTYLDIQAENKTNMLLGMTEVFGESRPAFRGVPIRVTDAILNTESRVV